MEIKPQKSTQGSLSYSPSLSLAPLSAKATPFPKAAALTSGERTTCFKQAYLFVRKSVNHTAMRKSGKRSSRIVLPCNSEKNCLNMVFGSIICCGKPSVRKSKGNKELTLRKFSLKELHSATNNFNYDNKLGEGAFGSVYWGQLWDGSQIAVKRLKVWSDKAEAEFSVEVKVLGQVRHKNLLTLRGYCSEGQERLIVYDYMPNLSLFAHLHGQISSEHLLDWTRRMNIAIGSAEGIAYLHTQATPHIIHRDIKASNILLDSDFQAKVADFGFAKFMPDGATHVTTMVKGTLGYLAPEYAMLGQAKQGIDVYSLGILLLELASGRRPLRSFDPSTRNIVEWALPLAREKRYREMADPKLNGKFVEDEVRRVIVVGVMSADKRPEKRPTVVEVVALLKGEAEEKLFDLENEVLNVGFGENRGKMGNDCDGV